MTTLSCKVTSVDAITDTVYRVRLVPEAAFSFRAGQYLMVVMDERDKRPFSMASTPAEQEFIELHIGASELNLYAMAVMDRILKEHEIQVDIPHGEAWLREDEDRPLILIAGGTGFPMYVPFCSPRWRRILSAISPSTGAVVKKNTCTICLSWKR